MKIVIKRRLNKNLANSPILEALQKLEERVVEKRRKVDAEVAKQVKLIKNRS
jgi:DNA-binding protein H-NS